MQKTFKALADPTRRRILELLRDRDMNAGEIAGNFETAWASISHHLNLLKEAELVTAERSGQNIVYSLNTTVFQDLLQYIYGLESADGRVAKRRVRDD